MPDRRSTRGTTSVRITKRVVDAADPSRGRHQIWDSELKGFGVLVEASGVRTYFVRYRPKGLGRQGPRRFIKIGRHGLVTPDEARVHAKAILGRVAAGDDPAAELGERRREAIERKTALTFGGLVERFLAEHVTVKRKPRSAAYYRSLLERHAKPSLENMPAAEVTRSAVSKLHLALRDKLHTANRLVAVVASMYSFAGKHGLVPEGFNPARGIEKYREQGRERYLTSDELQRLGAALVEGETIGLPWSIDPDDPKAKHTPKKWKDQRQKLDKHSVAALRLLLLTGARLREILDLRWREIDMDRGLLLLPDSKTGRKTIVLSEAATDVIRSLTPDGGLTMDGREDGYVIKGSQPGRPRADLKKPWAAVQRRAGLAGVRIHDLRHTFASVGAGASLGLPIVGKLLGHSQPQTTARYAHLDSDPLRRAANLIGHQLVTAMDASAKQRRTVDE